MKELRIKYKDQKSLEVLLKMLDTLGISYDFSESQIKSSENSNNVEIIEGKGKLDFQEMVEVFSKLDLDPVKLRENVWHRNL
jgi:imidazole glycerol phosphate synthase subunit HisF